MRSMRDRFRRFGKSLWIRPASPTERKLRSLRVSSGLALEPAYARNPWAPRDVFELVARSPRSGGPSHRVGV